MKKIIRRPLNGITSELGYVYIAPSYSTRLSSHKSPSQAVVLENGNPLTGPANSLHEDIRKYGNGRYSFWYEFVYFSTSDNSDPRENGRTYEIVYPENIGSFMWNLQKAFWDFGEGTDPAVRAEVHNPEIEQSLSDNITSSPLDAVVNNYKWLIDIWERVGYIHSPNSIVLVEDNSFDLIFSDQVFEHVMDYDAAFTEIKRILKPGGVCINIFPGKWKIRESHVYVPFASVFKTFVWLYIWALMGIQNEYQKGLSARETALRNLRYLRNGTAYLSRHQIYKHATKHFNSVCFSEEAYFYPNHQALFKRFPFLLPIYRSWFSDFVMRVLVLGKKI